MMNELQSTLIKAKTFANQTNVMKTYKKTWDKPTKYKWVSEMQEHQNLDRLQAGDWWDGEKGCFFGCAMRTDENTLAKAIEAMQLPPWLIYLAERIFEGLENGSDEQLTFPVRLLKSIPTNTCIESVKHAIAIKRLEPLVKIGGEVVSNIIELHKKWQDVTDEEWETAASSAASSVAYSAADSAADSAAYSAYSAVDSAASSAADSASSAADSAVYSAAYSAVYSAAYSVRFAQWSKEAENLIEELAKIEIL